MIAEVLHNKWLWAIFGIIVLWIFYRMLFAKDKSSENIEKEYYEILNSDKYKVKGQYD